MSRNSDEDSKDLQLVSTASTRALVPFVYNDTEPASTPYYSAESSVPTDKPYSLHGHEGYHHFDWLQELISEKTISDSPKTEIINDSGYVNARLLYITEEKVHDELGGLKEKLSGDIRTAPDDNRTVERLYMDFRNSIQSKGLVPDVPKRYCPCEGCVWLKYYD